jgi:hypothetical protein
MVFKRIVDLIQKKRLFLQSKFEKNALTTNYYLIEQGAFQQQEDIMEYAFSIADSTQKL